MGSIYLSGGNARLSYQLNGSYIANFRCKRIIISYGVNAQETHAKRYRAFYPYQRVQGSFALQFDFIHYAEYNQAMQWFKTYIEAVIGQEDPSYMQVAVDARNFLRLGYPTTGISFGDHIGSMVFSPTINFVSVADPRDPNAGITSLNKAVSGVSLPAGQTSSNYFYPTSKLNNPGALQSYLYDQQQIAAALAAAAVQDTIQGAAAADHNIETMDQQNADPGLPRAGGPRGNT